MTPGHQLHGSVIRMVDRSEEHRSLDGQARLIARHQTHLPALDTTVTMPTQPPIALLGWVNVEVTVMHIDVRREKSYCDLEQRRPGQQIKEHAMATDRRQEVQSLRPHPDFGRDLVDRGIGLSQLHGIELSDHRDPVALEPLHRLGRRAWLHRTHDFATRPLPRRSRARMRFVRASTRSRHVLEDRDKTDR